MIRASISLPRMLLLVAIMPTRPHASRFSPTICVYYEGYHRATLSATASRGIQPLMIHGAPSREEERGSYAGRRAAVMYDAKMLKSAVDDGTAIAASADTATMMISRVTAPNTPNHHV